MTNSIYGAISHLHFGKPAEFAHVPARIHDSKHSYFSICKYAAATGRNFTTVNTRVFSSSKFVEQTPGCVQISGAERNVTNLHKVRRMIETQGDLFCEGRTLRATCEKRRSLVTEPCSAQP
ncbi:hypothetical protein KM043_002109 [Ampulex compressa]|nr:hypothetical protein KM043_002109 [Ampulex compressa]